MTRPQDVLLTVSDHRPQDVQLAFDVLVQSGRLGHAVPFGHWFSPDLPRKKKRRREIELELLLQLSEV